MKKAVLYTPYKEKIVKCTACAHYCHVHEGKLGVCGIRKNIDGNLYLIPYGIAAAVNVDPIEKKPLFHFLPGSKIFSFSTVGCNFACEFCQNWDISQYVRDGGKIDEKSMGEKWSPERIVQYCLKNKIPAIACTYNEPTVFFEYAYDTLKLAKKNNIKTVFVSNGYGSIEAYEKLKKVLDGINVDLKAFNPDYYKNICHANIKPVLKNIKTVHEMGIWTEITTLIIPTVNDSDNELRQIAEFIADIDKEIPWHITRFYPQYKMKDKPPTPYATLEKAYEIGKKAGLKYIYIGNHPSDKESTFCPECNKKIIDRSGFFVGDVKIKKSKCEYCNAEIKGIWN